MANKTQNDARPKKQYQAPTLTDCGTVEEFTQSGAAGGIMDFGSS